MAFMSILFVILASLFCIVEAGLEPEASYTVLKVCSCQEKSCNIQDQPHILYHQVMTPLWIKTHASYLDPQHTAASDFLTFDKASTVANPVLVQIPILPPGKVPDSTPLSVELKVVLNTVIGTGIDSDIKFTLCDDQWCYGVYTVDKGNYGKHFPCVGTQGKIIGNVFTNEVNGPTSHNSAQYTYPSEFNIQFKLQERWVSCSAPVSAGGFFNSHVVANQLKPSKGLSLAVSKSDKGEQVAIAMMKVTVMKED